MSTAILVYVIYSRINKQIKEYEEGILIDRYERMFTAIMFEDHLSPLVFYYKDTSTEDDYHLNVLLRQLIRLHKQLVGEFAEKLRDYYIKSGLVEYSMKRLNSPFWNVKALGVIELSQMNIRESFGAISRLLKYKKNRYLMDVVQQGLIKLTDVSGLDVLVKQHTYISDWQQLKIMDMLKSSKTKDLPDFSTWFTYNYIPYDLFACRLIMHYQQHKAANEVIEKLSHRKAVVKKAAILVISNLRIEQASNRLKEIYITENKSIKMEILKCFENIMSENLMPFLIQVFEEQDYQLSKFAAYALKKNNQGFDWLMEKKQSTEGQHLQIINHVLDTRI